MSVRFNGFRTSHNWNAAVALSFKHSSVLKWLNLRVWKKQYVALVQLPAAVCALRWGSAGRKMFAALRNRVCSRRAAAAAWMLLLLPAVSLLLVVPSRRNFQSCRCLTLFQILDPEMRGSFPLWAQGCTHLGHLSCSQLHESLCSLICPAATQCSDGGDTSTKRALLVAKMGTLCLHSSSDIIDVKKNHNFDFLTFSFASTWCTEKEMIRSVFSVKWWIEKKASKTEISISFLCFDLVEE